MGTETKDFYYDVVVIGAGGAGLAAALTASESGARVAVLEKNPEVGGTTRLAVGSISAAGTFLQKRKGINDNPAYFDEDLKKFLGELEGRDNAELRRMIADRSADVVVWLEKLGVSFVGPFGEPPHRVPRMHNIVPRASASITALYKHVNKAGIDVSCDTRAVKLLLDENQSVIGVSAQTNDGVVTFHAEKGVILATGDFSNNPEMKARYLCPEAAEVDAINEASTGDGHKMGEEIGGQLRNMDVVFGPELRLAPPKKMPILERLPSNLFLNRILAALQRYSPPSVIRFIAKQMLTVRTAPSPKLFHHGAILVNSEGRRFTDETHEPAYAVAKQTGGMAYIIFDASVAKKFSSGEYYISTAPGIAYAYWEDYRKSRPDIVFSGKTADELASSMGIHQENLRKTIEEYNRSPEAVERGSIHTPPFFALGPAASVFITTEGGLGINRYCQVLNKQDELIQGLFAVGSVGQGGLVLAGHGLHILWAVLSGRIAGKAVTRKRS